MWLNIPVVAWLMLRGHSRCCHSRLSRADLAAEVWGVALFIYLAASRPTVELAPFVGAAWLLAAMVAARQPVLPWDRWRWAAAPTVVLVGAGAFDVWQAPLSTPWGAAAAAIAAAAACLIRPRLRQHAGLLIPTAAAAGAVAAAGGMGGVAVTAVVEAVALCFPILSPSTVVACLAAAGFIGAGVGDLPMWTIGAVAAVGFGLFIPAERNRLVHTGS